IREPGSSTRGRRRQCAEVPMKKTTYTESAHTADTTQPPADVTSANNGLPNRLMTAFEVAEFIGCHEETVRRAYLRGLLVSQRFGVRGRRFHPTDVLDWIRRGAPTRVSYSNGISRTTSRRRASRALTRSMDISKH